MADLYHRPSYAEEADQNSIVRYRYPLRAIGRAQKTRCKYKGPAEGNENCSKQVPNFSVSVLSSDEFRNRFVASVANERRCDSIGDLRGKKDVPRPGGRKQSNFLKIDEEVAEPSLNTKIVEYMPNSITKPLFERSSVLFYKLRF